MLQRIQSLYLLGVFIINGILPFLVSVWTNVDNKVVYAKDEMPVLLLFAGSALMVLTTVFLFKNRKLQFVLNRLNIILNITLLGLFVVRSLNLSGETLVSEKGIGMLFPIISIVFLVLANKAIKKDEDLVKSVDRLR
ncbi:DUF4293 domain-containing protein [Ascidiimonas aurantiaca]|uniref:DUF4293 domain-containing protein n=1 Tax=Ascidiimonas aurantiaca TaxID=1685432 RepID=UPI0030EC9434